MPKPIPVHSYFPNQPHQSPDAPLRIAARIILGIVGFGLASLLILGYRFGNIDDWGWHFFGIGAGFGAALTSITCNRFIQRKAARRVAFTLIGIGSTLDLAAIASYPLGRDILSGTPLVEISGIIPVIWIIVSIVPFSLAALCLLASAPMPRFDHAQKEA
jgi:hypothetical protein